MNLNAVHVFTKVVQAGSFRAAARELGMPRSTVSRRVSDLEEELGARLLQRTTRTLHLTEVGRTYFERCARVVAEMEAAAEAVRDMQAEPRGLLRVSTPLNFGMIAPVVSEYLARHPGTRVEIVGTDHVVDLVDAGVDLALRVGQLADSSLISRRLDAGVARLVASPAYLARHGTPRTPAELAEHDCIVFGTASRRTRLTLHAGTRTSSVDVPARLVANDWAVLRDAALRGLGIAVLPEEVCLGDIEGGALQPVLPAWRPPEVRLQVVYPSTRHLSPKVLAFLALLPAHFRREGGAV